jgi:predicted Zn-dependent peptidase
VPAASSRRPSSSCSCSSPGDFETTRDIAAQLVPLVEYGLPLDYYNGYVQSVERVTQADVQRVAERYLDPARLAGGDRGRPEDRGARAARRSAWAR